MSDELTLKDTEFLMRCFTKIHSLNIKLNQLDNEKSVFVLNEIEYKLKRDKILSEMNDLFNKASRWSNE